jgi:transcriptional regulator with XRE-family HTH domain
MNLTQMHERLRMELLRRIQRGTLSLSLLARQTGLTTSHLSNFLHGKRGLSFDAADRILYAQQMSLVDLLPASHYLSEAEQSGLVPVVSHEAAMYEPVIRTASVRRILHLPEEWLRDARSRSGPERKAWLRFVAIQVSPADADAMSPLIQPHALVVLDRHYNSLLRYRPERSNLYAVRHDAHLIVRYADYRANRLVLRPHNLHFPVELAEVAGDHAPGEFIVGRAIATLDQR